MDVSEIKMNFARLTGKQYDLLNELAKGRTLSEIAVRQGATEGSVARRLRALRTRFGMGDDGVVKLFKAGQNNVLDKQSTLPMDVLRPFLIDPISVVPQKLPVNETLPLFPWARRAS